MVNIVRSNSIKVGAMPLNSDTTSTWAEVGCPFIHFDELHRDDRTPALQHFAIIDELRAQAPMFFGEANGNDFWMPTRMAEIREVLQNHEAFSNTSVTVENPNPDFLWIPEMLDAPLHTRWRQLLAPFFSPAAIANRRPMIERRSAEIVDEVASRGECDFVTDVALRFPNTVFMEMAGLPVSEWSRFMEWERAILHSGPTGVGASMQGMKEVKSFFADLIEERRRDPRDDIVSASVGFEIDGAPVSDSDLLALWLLLFQAGLDTVASQLTYAIYHLARHEGDRRRLVEEPSLVPAAVEEFLRFYSFVPAGRKIVQDAVLGGCPMKAGQMVNLPLSSANRDENEFPDANTFVLDRAANRHIAFGAGPHRCLGSHLAREELCIGLSDWLARVPDFRVVPGVELVEHGGMYGLDHLPLEWEVIR